MDKFGYAILAVVLLSFAISAYFYPQMPERVASHWDEKGQVNGHMDRFWGTFFVPILAAVLGALFYFIPKIDPLRANYGGFRKYYDGFVVTILAFMLYIHLLTIWWNLGGKFSLLQFMSPAFGALFFYLGVLLENAKQNWFVGFRTPWTLSSEIVWEKTHKLGGKLFKIAAAFALIGIFLPEQAIWLVLFPIIAVSIYVFAYSYFEFRNEKKTKKTESERNN